MYRRLIAFFWGVLVACSAGGFLMADETDPEGADLPTAAATPDAAAEPATADDAVQKSLAELSTNYGNLKVVADTLWVLITGMLVFFMNLGFACVESGMCRAKNCVNILSKNFIVFAVTSVAFWFLGWGLMFGDGNGFIGQEGLFMVHGADNSPSLINTDAALNKYEGVYKGIAWTGVPLWAKFFFQLVFAGTAATIVSGAVAERIKYHSFIIFSIFMAIVIYPVVGHWIWGGGWLANDYNFLDFAGSTQVHSIGGWAALVGILFLGPRIGKYGADGKVRPIPGHSMMAATIGCFVLWLGWFGFNPGSTMAADPGFIADVAVVTNTGGAVATLTATITAWLMLGKPDVGMTLNGCLAGLVAVTAACAWISVESAAIIGAISGVLVVFAVVGFDKIKIDDPVGATSVHLVNGVFGTLCVGLFSDPKIMASRGLDPVKFKGGLFFGGGMDQLIAQLIGIFATAAYVLVASVAVWALLKATVGIRVSKEEEIEGLDHGEHGNEAYHGFVIQES
ncbi:MAG: ammonium transporter [Planctomycetales bacterium]